MQLSFREKFENLSGVFTVFPKCPPYPPSTEAEKHTWDHLLNPFSYPTKKVSNCLKFLIMSWVGEPTLSEDLVLLPSLLDHWRHHHLFSSLSPNY